MVRKNIQALKMNVDNELVCRIESNNIEELNYRRTYALIFTVWVLVFNFKVYSINSAKHR